MKLAIVQTNPRIGETKINVQQAISLMETAEADFYVLPELSNTGYNFISRDEVAGCSETPDGYTFQEMFSFAKKRNCYVVYGFAEKASEGADMKYYNSSALVSPKGLEGVYRKVHLFYRENIFFSPGNLGFPIFDLPIGKIGMMICFDWYFPESARTLALAGAQLIAHPSNLVMSHCPDAMVTRCLENRVYAATCNRVGVEDRGGERLEYIGKSEIVSTKGEILVRLSENEVGIAVREIDLTIAKSKRLNEFNDLFLQRKTEYYKL